MASKYFENNEVDTTSKDLLSEKILVKTVKQVVDSEVWDGLFGVFQRNELGVGFQWEEIETANLTSIEFDKTGAEALTRKNMDFKSLYHKINRRRTFQATISDAQVKMACLNESNMASISSAISAEMLNSSAIEDYDAVKDLMKDILNEKKVMTLVDLNDTGENMDAFIKAVQVIATNMTIPSTHYNYSGFKKAFSRKDNLVLVVDSATKARLNVDSLASAFNIDKKELVGNIIVVDEMPSIEYTSEKAKKGVEITIGDGQTITTYKPVATGDDATVTGKVKALLVDKRAIIVDPVEREMTEQYNAKGRFTNLYYHVTDVLSYSTLKNAVAFVD